MGKFIGFLILAIGALLLLGNVGVIPQRSLGDTISTFWPLVLVYWGLSGLWWSWKRRQGFWGSIWSIVLLLLGAGFLLQNLHWDVLPFSVWNLLIPVGLIIAGLSILFGKKRSWRNMTGIDYDWKHHRRHHDHDHHHAQGLWEDVLEGGGRHIHVAMGDMEVGGPEWKLENTRIDCKMGSIKVDLRETPIPDGETVLDVYCKAGSVKVLLPDGLPIWVESNVKFGNVQLLRQNNSGMGTRYFKSDNYDEAERKIRMRIFVKFGDVDVKQFG